MIWRRSPVCVSSTSATTWSSCAANELSRQPKWICAPACSLGAAPQHALEHDLRDVVGDFRRRPIRIGPRQPAELVAAEPRHISGGARDVRRQALGAQLVGDAEAAEMLHRARVGVVALGMLRGVELLGHQHGRHRAPAELDRRRQADRSAADDQRKGFGVHRVSARVHARSQRQRAPRGAGRETRRRGAGLPGRCRGRCRRTCATRPARRARRARSTRGTAPARG